MSCLILGASFNQLELIKKSKRRGLFTVVVTPNEADPGVTIADAHIKEDIRNIPEILSQCAQFRPRLCITDQSDLALMCQAFICAELAIPGPSVGVAQSFCDKYKCYTTIAASGKRFHPETFYFDSTDAAEDYLPNVLTERFKWIVKPINSQGSRGVGRLGSDDDSSLLRSALNESDGAGLIIQRYVDGRHFSVDAVITPDQYHTLVVAEKSKYTANANLDKRLVLMSPTQVPVLGSIANFHREVVEAMGLQLGLTHGEYVLSHDGKIYLIEVAARGGGGNINGKITKYISGFDPLDFIIDVGLGSIPKISIDDETGRCAILHFFDSDAEICTDLKIAEHSDLIHFEYRESVHKVSQPQDSRVRPGYFIVTGESYSNALVNESHLLARLGQQQVDHNILPAYVNNTDA